MGVTYSSDSTSSDVREKLRFTQQGVETLVSASITHRAPLFVDQSGLKSLLCASVDPQLTGMLPDGSFSVTDFMNTVWDIFSEDGIIITREFLVIIVLLLDCPWAYRLSLLFNMYKNIGTEHMMYDDLVLLLKTALSALLKLWKDTFIDGTTMALLPGHIDTIATSVFLKLERDILKPLERDEFVQWAFERFRETKTVATKETLLAMYGSSH
jgi:hypothetical protein